MRKKVGFFAILMFIGSLLLAIPNVQAAPKDLKPASEVPIKKVHDEANNLLKPLKTDPFLRIGLWTGQANVLLSSDGEFDILDGQTGEFLAHHLPKQSITVSIRNGQLTLNSQPVDAKKLKIVSTEEEEFLEDYALEVNKRQYRGSIEIFKSLGRSGLTVVNIVSVEQYLGGVLPKEISPDWNLEAVKAQAVAARTYALANQGKHRSEGFDLCSTTDCQVYGGKTSEKLRSNQAIAKTKGFVLSYQGKLITAYFHSSAGGYTENSENVWGTTVPYLRAVPDYDQSSPHFHWQKIITAQDLNWALKRAGYHVGQVESIQLSPLTVQPVDTFDRGPSGRVKTIKIIGTQGRAVLTGNTFRQLFNLNSTLFDVKVMAPNSHTLDVDITDTYGDFERKKVEMKLPDWTERKGPLDNENIRRLNGMFGEYLVINGLGWGHGLGLSQWGSKAMADQAPPSSIDYYKKILAHYYPGTQLAKYY